MGERAPFVRILGLILIFLGSFGLTWGLFTGASWLLYDWLSPIVSWAPLYQRLCEI